ncbi:hypothetical protein [Microbacterium sp. NPDC076911]|uniref:hypothetical protein n=1 Tax=Microbacterium sp. NPDC076911 TaxID=3154958 RepID=UPI00342B47EA
MVKNRLLRHLGTPSAIYGLLVFASLIAAMAVNRHEGDTVASVFVFSTVTLVVFWAAHVYAYSLAHHADERADGATIWASLTHGANESVGMLEAAVLPAIFLLLGVFEVLTPPRAIFLALLSATAMLGVLGFVAFAIREGRWWVRLLGALGTAAFGVLIILLESSLH